jgi:pimeloyl-ACP methyl ester carboxylesterase
MATPIDAYRGTDPYVFVCYSHADTDAVYRDIALLASKGLNIWYDEGISPGSEWSEELGNAIDKATLVLFYASTRSANSRHCRDEINFAHNHDKQVLAIYLEQTELPVGLELSLSSTQAVMKYKLNDDDYLPRILSVLPAETFGHATEVREQLGTTTRKSPWRTVGFAAAAVALVALLVGWFNRETLIANYILWAPEFFGDAIEQDIGFATSTDNVRIAYATTGEGLPIVTVLGWATHLQRGFNSPTYDNQGVLAMSSRNHMMVRYDGRGFGLSDRQVEDYSLEARVSDIEAVVDALGVERFALYALSAGGQAGIAYTHKHPEKVTALVLASTFAQTNQLEAALDSFSKRLELMKSDWESPAVRNLLIESLFPDLKGVNAQIMGEFLRRSSDGSSIHGFFGATLEIDVSELAKDIHVPTLVIHGRDDATVPLESGRRLASLIPNARFEIVEGGHGPGTGMAPDSRRLILDFIKEVSN